MQFEEFERKILEEVDLLEDCLRLYRLPESPSHFIKEYGKFKAIDFDGPLVV